MFQVKVIQGHEVKEVKQWILFYSGCDTQNETFLHFKSNGKSLDNKSKRKVRLWSRSGQGQVKWGQILNLIFLHQMGVHSMPLVAGISMVVFVFC